MIGTHQLERVYGSWNGKRLYCLCLNLGQLDNPSEDDKNRLAVATKNLANRPFHERLKFYTDVVKKMNSCAESDNFEGAAEYKRQAEDFKRHFLD